MPCLLLQPSSEQQSPKGGELELSPFHLPLPWHLATFPTFLQQAATSSGGFTLLNVVGLAHLQRGGCSAGVTASVPEVPRLSRPGSGLGAGSPSICQRWVEVLVWQPAASSRDNSYLVCCWLSSALPRMVTISACHGSPLWIQSCRQQTRSKDVCLCSFSVCALSLHQQTLGKWTLLPSHFAPFLAYLAFSVFCADLVL